MTENARGKAAAFFDLDRTLIDVNSGALYARYERRMKRISLGQYLTSGVWLMLYFFSLADMEKAYRRAVRHYTGELEDVIDQRTQEWFATEVAHRIQPGALAVLEEHRAQGHPLVLLTGSSSYISRLSIVEWSLDDWIANEFETDAEGRLTGEVSDPLCYGSGKVHWAEKWAAANEVDLDASYFYSDSFSDKPMLERVPYPRVVNPDPKLRRFANQCGWPILDWRTA